MTPEVALALTGERRGHGARRGHLFALARVVPTCSPSPASALASPLRPPRRHARAERRGSRRPARAVHHDADHLAVVTSERAPRLVGVVPGRATGLGDQQDLVAQASNGSRVAHRQKSAALHEDDVEHDGRLLAAAGRSAGRPSNARRVACRRAAGDDAVRQRRCRPCAGRCPLPASRRGALRSRLASVPSPASSVVRPDAAASPFRRAGRPRSAGLARRSSASWAAMPAATSPAADTAAARRDHQHTAFRASARTRGARPGRRTLRHAHRRSGRSALAGRRARVPRAPPRSPPAHEPPVEAIEDAARWRVRG